MKHAWRLLLALVQVLLFARSTIAAIHPYGSGSFKRYGDAQIYRAGREGLFASRLEYVEDLDAYEYYGYDFAMQLLAPGVSNGESYIRLDKISVERSEESANLPHSPSYLPSAMLDIVVFELDQKDQVGVQTSRGWQYCCTEELAEEISCAKGRLIVGEVDEHDFPMVRSLTFYNNNTESDAVVDQGVVIPTSGMYYMWIVSCDLKQTGLKVLGSSVWKNPGGYLPGMMLPNLKFSGAMAILYLLLGLVWGIACLVQRRSLVTLQHFISALVGLSALEMVTWYFDFVGFNQTGSRPVAVTQLAVLAGCLRKTLSRVVVLLVCMGYGTLRPTLGGLSGKIVSLTAAYFAAIAAYDFTANVGRVDDLSSLEKIILVLPAAVLDAVIVMSIFSALSRTLQLLQAKKQDVKLGLYKQFTNCLAVAIWSSIMWLAYETWFRMSDMDNNKWEYEWVCNAFWHVLNFVFLTAICVLWRPNSGSISRFAYNKDDAQAAEAERLRPTPGTPKAAVNTDVFAIDDETAEEAKTD